MPVRLGHQGEEILFNIYILEIVIYCCGGGDQQIRNLKLTSFYVDLDDLERKCLAANECAHSHSEPSVQFSDNSFRHTPTANDD